jgi:hypothetical protein
VVGEDLAQRRLDLLRPVHLAAVEADAVALGFEEGREPGRVPCVPAFEQGPIELFRRGCVCLLFGQGVIRIALAVSLPEQAGRCGTDLLPLRYISATAERRWSGSEIFKYGQWRYQRVGACP